MKYCSIIVAAGASSRMKIEKSKLLLKVNSHTIINKTLMVFEKCSIIDEIILVIREEDEKDMIKECQGITKLKKIVYGGATRQDSVINGINQAVNCDYVVIHDAARPFVRDVDIINVCEKASVYKASSLAVKAKDTIKQTDKDNFVTNTPDRSLLWQVQTPQVFDKSLYLEMAKLATSQGFNFTDDCQLFEQFGKKVYMCEGDYKNIKITTAEDLLIATAFDGGNMFRIGQGYDVHKLVENRKLILGGVEIPFEKGLLGHSDADVLLHAISDSILGAAAMGDIGKLFPDTDKNYKNADSLELLKEVIRQVKAKNLKVNNIDATVVAQRPKLASYIELMRENIAKAVEIDIDFVSVKATTEEKLGFTGTGEGISSHAVCTLISL